MTAPESPRNTPASTPTKTPSDTLLRNFRATLEAGWEKFDNAVPSAGKSGIFASEDYARMKTEYESAKKMLEGIKNDDELRANVPMRQKLDETIKMLRKHNAESDKNEGYNKALVEMEQSLAALQKDVEKNNTTLPPVTVVAATGGGALATEAVSSLGEVIKDGTRSLETEAKDIKKNPMKKIAEFLGFNESNILSDFKESLAEKKAGGLDGFFGSIKIWFYGLLAKIMGVDIAKGLTPEELKLAGMKPKKEELGRQQNESQSIVDDIAMKAGYKGFVRMYYSSIDGIEKGVKPTDIDSAFQYTAFLNMRYSDAQSLFERYKNNHKGLSTELQFSGITNVEGAFAALALLVSGGSSLFLKKRFGDSLNNLSIKEVFVGIKDSFGIAESIEDIEISAFEDVTGFMGKIGEKMDISLKDGKINQDGMRVKAERLGLGNPKFLSFTLFEAANKPVAEFSTESSIDGLYPIDEEGKKKLREILAFGKLIMPVLIKNCSFGESGKYAEEFKKVNPTLADITKMYIALGGNTDFSTMSQAEHLYCYQRTWHFLGNSNFRGEYFDQPMIRAITDKSQNILPPETKEMLSRLMSKSFSKFMEKMTGIAGEIYGLMKWYHIAGAGAVIGAYFLWGKKLAWIGTGAAMASLAIIVSNVLSSVSQVGSDGRFTLPSGTKVTKEEGAEALVAEATRIGTK